MGYDATRQVPGDRLTGVPVSGRGRGERDQFEYGSLFPLTRQGRYKAFATPFSARPVVVVTPLNGATGTAVPVLYGTPNVGSFRARMQLPGAAAGAGSVNAYFAAFGPR